MLSFRVRRAATAVQLYQGGSCPDQEPAATLPSPAPEPCVAQRCAAGDGAVTPSTKQELVFLKYFSLPLIFCHRREWLAHLYIFFIRNWYSQRKEQLRCSVGELVGCCGSCGMNS